MADNSNQIPASSPDTCRKHRQCSKTDGHKGRCNSEKEINPFWKTSPVYNLNIRTQQLALQERQLTEEREEVFSRLKVEEENFQLEKSKIENNLSETEAKFEALKQEKEVREKEATELKDELQNLKQRYDQVKSMLVVLGLDPRQFSKSKREQNPTSQSMIGNYNSSTRYARRKETQKALQFIHGGNPGSFYGAWDYVAANAPTELIDEFLKGYKRGKYLQETFGKAMRDFQASPEALNHSVALKYQNYLPYGIVTCLNMF